MFKADMGLMNYRNAGCMSCGSKILTETSLINCGHGRRRSGE